MIDPIAMIRPRRKIQGASAILLPFLQDGSVDWPGFVAHVERTADAGLIPAVNMDTGYVNLLDESTKLKVLEQTKSVMAGRSYFAGAFVGDQPDSRFNSDAYARSMNLIAEHDGVPVVFQSYGLVDQSDDDIVSSYLHLGEYGPFVGFELGQQFAPFGRIYSIDVYRGLLGIKQCLGAKHSSLRRDLEWERILLRDEIRPDFHVYTGNDLAIDMVIYGSDYLLGLSTFAPDVFAKRDALWLAGDPAFYELNDVLQYLGLVAFRPPVPAYKHSAAMFFHMRGWIDSDETHPQCPKRPDSDRDLLNDIRIRLKMFMKD